MYQQTVLAFCSLGLVAASFFNPEDYPHMLANAQADRNGPESSTRNPHSNIDIHTYEETTRNPHSNIDPPQAPLIQVKLNVGRLMQLLLNKNINSDGTITLDVPDNAITLDNNRVQGSPSAVVPLARRGQETTTLASTTTSTQETPVENAVYGSDNNVPSNH